MRAASQEDELKYSATFLEAPQHFKKGKFNFGNGHEVFKLERAGGKIYRNQKAKTYTGTLNQTSANRNRHIHE